MELILAHPLFVIISGACITAFFGLFGFLLSQYAFTPKRCKKQVDNCQSMIAGEFAKRDKIKKDCEEEFGDEAAKIHDRISKFAEKADKVYVRRDAVIPTLELIHKEVQELRGMIFKFLKVNGHGG